jgi:hypothetical protein
MDYSRNPKVVGAFLVGFALVAGAYVLSTFGTPSGGEAGTLYAVANAAPARVYIPVTDTNTDGLEDWRDQFVVAPAVTIAEVTESDYIAPTTLTGQLGVSLIEDLITSTGAGPIGRPKEELVEDAIKQLERVATTDKIYDVRDITITTDNSDATIRSYGNSLADILITASDGDLENELVILEEYIANTDQGTSTDLIALAKVYQNYRDRTLALPVPKQFVKTHLDLVNVYNALYQNISTMTKAKSDPMLAYVRLKRYEEDVEGLSLALNNVYSVAVPYARVFEQNDSAILFAYFSREINN